MVQRAKKEKQNVARRRAGVRGWKAMRFGAGAEIEGGKIRKARGERV